IRKIERQLNIGWRTIRKYLAAPAQDPLRRDRPSKLDPFKGNITEWLEKDPRVTAAVIEQKLRSLGYQGGHSIIREYVRNARPEPPKRAFVRMEPLGRRALRSRLGSLRRSQLLRRFAQTLCHRVSRCAQQNAVCRVHAQSELRNLRPVSHSCV